jgi:DNA-binding LacI/PurR family transcriptional regulator
VLRRLHDQGFPVVLLDRRVEGVVFDLVGIDNEAAGYVATEHLIRRGHRRVGHVTHPMKVNPIGERRRGYERALRDYGLAGREEWIEFTDDEAGAYQDAGIRRLLEGRERPTGVFAVSDRPALRVLREAYALGLRVPEEVALVGVDDIPGARTAAVPLTTIRQPFGEMGERAVERALERIGGAREEAAMILLPTELVVRTSTDPQARGETVYRTRRAAPPGKFAGALG